MWFDETYKSSACGAHHVPESNSPWFELPNIPARLNTLYQIPLKAYNFQWLLTLAAYLQTHRQQGGGKPPEYTFLCLVVFSAAANLFIFHFLSGGWEESRGTKSLSASLCNVNTVSFSLFLSEEKSPFLLFNMLIFHSALRKCTVLHYIQTEKTYTDIYFV